MNLRNYLKEWMLRWSAKTNIARCLVDVERIVYSVLECSERMIGNILNQPRLDFFRAGIYFIFYQTTCKTIHIFFDKNLRSY